MKKKSFFKKIKIFKRIKLGTLHKVLISSLITLMFFYSMPILINFKNEKFLEHQNNSKAILAYTLNQKKLDNTDDNQYLNENDLLVDIFSLNDLETDTVRLNAATIKQLFEDTNYTLKEVREKKLVKPVALTLLPNEIKMIENTKKKKRLFYTNYFTVNFKRK